MYQILNQENPIRGTKTLSFLQGKWCCLRKITSNVWIWISISKSKRGKSMWSWQGLWGQIPGNPRTLPSNCPILWGVSDKLSPTFRFRVILMMLPCLHFYGNQINSWINPNYLGLELEIVIVTCMHGVLISVVLQGM